MKWAKSTIRLVAPVALLSVPVACLHVKTDPVEIKPIHIVADVNVNVKVDRELDEFFGFDRTTPPPAATAPAATSDRGGQDAGTVAHQQ